MNEEKIKISINEEDVQNIIDCYEKDIKYIEALEKENKELKEKLLKLEEKYIHQVPCCNEEDCDLFKEHQQLKHILDELEKWAEEEMNDPFNYYSEVMAHYKYEDFLDKIKELRGRE